MKNFKLTETGFDSSIENEHSIIEVANTHCSQYNDGREVLLPITTVEGAISYLKQYGFTVEVL